MLWSSLFLFYMYVGNTINDMPLWIPFRPSDQWHPVRSLKSAMMEILTNHGNWQILHIRAFLFSYWLSRLKKMVDKMLIIQIKFKIHHVPKCCIMNNTKKLKTVFQDLKIVIQMRKVALSLMTKRSADMHLCCFPFILLVNKNQNISCYSCWNYTCLSLATISWL